MRGICYSLPQDNSSLLAGERVCLEFSHFDTSNNFGFIYMWNFLIFNTDRIRLDILQPLQVWAGDLLRMKVENAKETKALYTMTMRLQAFPVQSDGCCWLPWSLELCSSVVTLCGVWSKLSIERRQLMWQVWMWGTEDYTPLSVSSARGMFF